MKQFIILFFVAAVALTVACTDSNNQLGLNIRPAGDAIILGSDTLAINSLSVLAQDSVASPSDTLLLGRLTDNLGTTTGNILSQFTCPVGFQFPEGSTADSIALFIIFNKWSGASTSAIEISAYQMDGDVLQYNTPYYTNIDTKRFCSENTLMGKRIIVSIPDTVSNSATYQPYIKYKFDQSYARYFYDAAINGNFANKDNFNSYFKGIFLKTTHEDGVLFYVTQIYIKLYYSYPAFVDNQNVRLTSGLVFPASKDVRQINSITSSVSPDLTNAPDSLTYISTPGGLYTKIQLPVGRILQKVNSKFKGRVQSFNFANLNVEVSKTDTSQFRPVPQRLLLVKAKNITAVNSFIRNYDFTTDTLITASYNPIKQCYSFDLSLLLTKRLKQANGNIDPNVTEDYILVPVQVTGVSSTTSSILAFQPQYVLGATALRTKKAQSPLRIETVYSGY